MKLFLYLYLFVGFIYGVYVTFRGGGKWYLFPLNVLGGPIVSFVIIYKVITGKKIYY